MLIPSAIRAAVAVVALVLPMSAAQAQAAAPMRLIVPFNPGGGSDLFGRLISQGLGEAMKETVIVENRAGAGGIIGTDAVAKSIPDQKLFLVADSALYTIMPALQPKLSYKREDLAPVANLAAFGNVLVVGANSPYKTFQDILAAARAKPGTLTIGSSGTGGITHLTAEKLMAAADIKLLHVPYKGSGPATTDAAGGHVDMVFTGLPSVLELLRAGKLRALALAMAQRVSDAPDIPTISESGVPGFESMISQGLFAPAGTPAETVKRMNKAVTDLMRTPTMQESLRKMTVQPVYDTAEEYKAWLDKEAATWSALIKQANVKID